MNARHFFTRPKALAATALLALAGAAQAGGVSWSVGVHAPVIYGPGQVSAVVSNGRGGYHYPPPVVYVQPRYYGVQPVIYQPPPPQYRPYRGWGRWHQGRAEAYDRGYRRGYERGYDRGNDDDDRRGWGPGPRHGR